MSSLTADSKRRIQQELARINVWLKNAQDKLQEVEDKGVAAGEAAAAGATADEIARLLPDFAAANELVRQWLGDSIRLKYELINDWFPDYDVGEDQKFEFDELYDFSLQFEQYASWIEIFVRKSLEAQNDEDIDLGEFEFLAELVEFHVRKLRERLKSRFRDPNVRRELENVIRQLERVAALLRSILRWRRSPLWRFLKRSLLRLLRGFAGRLRDAWRQFLRVLDGPDYLFRYATTLELLRTLDRLIEEVLNTEVPGELPLLLPGIARIRIARRYKEELERLIRATPTRG